MPIALTAPHLCARLKNQWALRGNKSLKEKFDWEIVCDGFDFVRSEQITRCAPFKGTEICSSLFSTEGEIDSDSGVEIRQKSSEIVNRHKQSGSEEPSSLDGKNRNKIRRELHNESQAEFFDRNFDFFLQEVPDVVQGRLREVASSAMLKNSDKILDCGSGTGALIPFIQNAGALDITAIDLSPMMLSEVKERFDDVFCWNGDIVDLPDCEFGPFDAIFFNAMFGNVSSQNETIKAAIRLSNPGTRLIISHPLGSNFVEELRAESPKIVPHSLPTMQTLNGWVQTLGLEILLFRDEPELYITILKVTATSKKRLDDLCYFWRAPLYLEGPVVAGFGRGSKQMGVPTANLDPEELEAELEGVKNGVYFGFAQVPAVDTQVHEMVMNVGKRPTFVDGDGISIEVHILHKFPDDFYGKGMKVVVLGYIRPEMKFDSLDSLVERITKDISVAKEELQSGKWELFSRDNFFTL